ncbi:DUF4019 domain-containing protein [Tunturiibacter gelidoferens]|uniref:DUF4019 domain-containing protein n=2 Tax=Tunturiibacter TaxID=3154218 RepID=A0A7Y9T3H9_9BACT|nr:DUF4019 domain-containing protein [Edaphobacter lichenicola]MBB5337928.1 hypothetical protein [Edaphobacter lichenicola]NYF52843.1 hypothetical protein [Edaphobacter lichenicola]
MRRVSRIVLAVCVVVGATRGQLSFAMQEHAPQAQQDAVQLAARDAEEWMIKLDAGKYAECWTEASQMVKNAVTMEKFESSMKAVRDPMGKLESRKLQSASHTTLLPGVPSGEYVVILYETSFDHKPTAQETVIMSREKDKVWRVAGYYIK